MPVVNVKGMGLMRIAQQSQPQATAGIQSRVNKQNAFDDRVQGVLSGIGNQIADVAINDEGELNNPAQLKAALDNKFQEVRNFTDMVTQGLTPTQKAAFLTMGVNGLGDITGLAADMEMYITDPESRTWFNAMMSGAGVAGGAVSISPSMAAMLPIIRKNIDAWQGSPHKFDRMSSAHIGTGEGAQAYGHGLYFAEQKGIGEGYRDALSSAILVDGKPISNQTNDYMEKKLLKAGFDPDKAIDLINAEIDPSDISKIGKIRQEGATSAIDRLTDLKARDAIQTQEGYLYNVDLKVSPDDLLDWDAPLSEQSERVREKISGLYKDYSVSDDAPFNEYLKKEFPSFYEDWGSLTAGQQSSALGAYSQDTGKVAPMVRTGSGDKPTMERFYKALSADQVQASEILREAGIPGIKYYDGGSRGAGEGTRNFVIFDDSLIDIKTRNGEALTPVQRQSAVSEMMGGDTVPAAMPEIDTSQVYYRGRNKDRLGKPLRTSTGDDRGFEHAVRGVSTAKDRDYAAFHGEVEEYYGPKGEFIDAFQLMEDATTDLIAPEHLWINSDGDVEGVLAEFSDLYPGKITTLNDLGEPMGSDVLNLTDDALADWAQSKGYVGSYFNDPFAGEDFRFFDPNSLVETKKYNNK